MLISGLSEFVWNYSISPPYKSIYMDTSPTQAQLAQWVRPHIRNLNPYSSARTEYTGKSGIFLDANENPLGSATQQAYNRYPDPLQQELKQKLASLKGVTSEQIFLGNGSDEAIDLLIRAFCEPNTDHLLILPPTYGMYTVSAAINQVEVRSVSLSPDFQIDLPPTLESLTSHTKLVFLCSPNNPTGNLLRQEDVLAVINAQQHGLVILDEAYIDFASRESLLSLLDSFPNLVILQTFSKAWGLAGLRLGMAFAHPYVIDILNRIKPPYNINQVTQELGLEALAQVGTKDHLVAQILSEKNRLEELLPKIAGVQHVYPSEANFLLVKMENPNAVYEQLLQEFIILRNRSHVHLCAGCLRISIGTPEENDRMLEGLQKVLKEVV